MYTVIDSVDDHYSLQHDLNSLENWSDTWQMKFNPAKCAHLAITNKRIYIKNCYQIYGQPNIQYTKVPNATTVVNKDT